MNAIDIQTTVGELVKERPARARTFEQFKIDYCCGGKMSLAEACKKRDVAPETLLQAFECDESTITETLIDADTMSLTELADHIIATHHGYLRQELPRLDFMTRKVAAVHGDNEARLLEIREVFVPFMDELTHHIEKEEQILFPIIREIDSTTTLTESDRASLASSIRVMENEHNSAGEALEKFRNLTNDFTPPEWACNTFRAMYNSFAELEQNMHQHVHKENNVLFPKALQRESELIGSELGSK